MTKAKKTSAIAGAVAALGLLTLSLVLGIDDESSIDLHAAIDRTQLVLQRLDTANCETVVEPVTGLCVADYCEANPQWCQYCAAPPCGDPLEYVCCSRDGACWGVNTPGECGSGTLYWCEDGYQGFDPATGKPYVVCYDDEE